MVIYWNLLLTSLIIAFGSSFQSGYFVSLYNVPQDVIETYINESILFHWDQKLTPIEISTIWSTIASTNQAGKLIACFLSPVFADRWGRKNTLLLANFLSLLGIALQFNAMPTKFFPLLALGRFVTGFYNGLISVLVPLFLVEIAVLPSLRAWVTRIHNVVSILGNILSLLFGIPEILGTSELWGYLTLVPLPLILLETVWLFRIPETPMHLLQAGKSEEVVQKSLQYYLGTTSNECSEAMNKTDGRQMKNEGAFCGLCQTTKEMLRYASNRNTFILWVMLALSASFSGGSITMNYLTAMIAGFSTFNAFDKHSAVAVNSAKILVVLGCLCILDKFGRKLLLVVTVWSVQACLIILACVAFAQDNFHVLGEGPGTWARIIVLFLWTSIQYVVNSTATLVVSETAKQNSRALSLAVFKVVYHLSGIILTVIFPPIARSSEGGSYVLLAVPFLLICVYVTSACPETKGVDFFEVELEAQYGSTKTLVEPIQERCSTSNKGNRSDTMSDQAKASTS